MDDGLKQRLIGAIVLVAIGIIFIPGLLDKEGRREVDLSTQVPPEPAVMPRPLEIPDPIRPENIVPPKDQEQNYSHASDGLVLENNLPEVDTPEPSQNSTSPDLTSRVVETPEPGAVLNAEGVPRAWSIQVSSFESEKNADGFERRLLDAGYTAYIQTSTTNSVTVYRVFVGPKINRQTALATKAEIDKAFKIQAMLVEFKP